MAFSKVERRAIEKQLASYSEGRVPADLRDKLRIVYQIKGESVTLLESRPGFADPTQWIDVVVARFRRNQESGEWTLYWADRNSKWHVYEGFKPKKTLRPLLAEVDRDPTGIFWG